MADPVTQSTLVRCPCCEGYRDRGDGTHDHCRWCDDEGEVTPQRAAEYAVDAPEVDDGDYHQYIWGGHHD